MLQENEYATKDLHLASFLKVKGLDIKRLERFPERSRRGQNPAYFIFDGETRCKELERVYWNKVGTEIMVNVKEYVDTVRDLRSMIFSVINSK